MSENSPQEPQEPAEPRAPVREYARLSSMGFEFSASVALLGWLGWLLDGFFGLQEQFPAFLLVGVFLGVGLGIYRLQLKLGSRSTQDSSPPEDSDS